MQIGSKAGDLDKDVSGVGTGSIARAFKGSILPITGRTIITAQSAEKSETS
jgi:hypothetical protein